MMLFLKGMYSLEWFIETYGEDGQQLYDRYDEFMEEVLNRKQ